MCFDKRALLEIKARQGGGKTGVATHTVTYSVKIWVQNMRFKKKTEVCGGGTKNKLQHLKEMELLFYTHKPMRLTSRFEPSD